MKVLLALGVILSSATAVMAQAPRNPNDVLCRSSGDTGSRLSRSRVCMTRAEWAEIKRTTRQTIDRAQTRQFNKTIDEKGRMTN